MGKRNVDGLGGYLSLIAHRNFGNWQDQSADSIPAESFHLGDEDETTTSPAALRGEETETRDQGPGTRGLL